MSFVRSANTLKSGIEGNVCFMVSGTRGFEQYCGCEHVFNLQPAAPAPPIQPEGEQENRGIKSSPMMQRYARMWSSTEGIERRFSLHDRYLAVRTFVHAIDHLVKNEPDFLNRANSQMTLQDGIYNALDHRATGREWRNIRHTYNPERDGPHPPTEAEEDRRCERCGAIRPERFTHCHAKNHVPAAAAPSGATAAPTSQGDRCLDCGHSEGTDDSGRCRFMYVAADPSQMVDTSPANQCSHYCPRSTGERIARKHLPFHDYDKPLSKPGQQLATDIDSAIQQARAQRIALTGDMLGGL